MFSKSVSVLLLAFCLVQPNEAIFGLDGVLQGFYSSWASGANNSTLNQTAQSIANLLARQAFQPTDLGVDLINKVNLSIINYKNNLTTTYNVSSMLSDICIAASLPNVNTLSASIIASFMNACKPNISDAMLIAGNISLVSQNITKIIMNFNSTYMTACPPPAAGDFIGGILWRLSQPLCFSTTAAGIASNAFSMGIGIADYQSRLNAIIQSVTSFDYAACQAKFLKTYQAQELVTVMAPLQQCFVLVSG